MHGGVDIAFECAGFCGDQGCIKRGIGHFSCAPYHFDFVWRLDAPQMGDDVGGVGEVGDFGGDGKAIGVGQSRCARFPPDPFAMEGALTQEVGEVTGGRSALIFRPNMDAVVGNDGRVLRLAQVG